MQNDNILRNGNVMYSLRKEDREQMAVRKYNNGQLACRWLCTQKKDLSLACLKGHLENISKHQI